MRNTRQIPSGITIESMLPDFDEITHTKGSFERKNIKKQCNACKEPAACRIIIKKYVGRDEKGTKAIYDKYDFYLCEKCARFMSDHLKIYAKSEK